MEIIRSNIKNMGTCNDNLIEMIYGIHDCDYQNNKDMNHKNHILFINEFIEGEEFKRDRNQRNYLYYDVDKNNNLLKITTEFDDDLFFSETIDIDEENKFFMASYYNGGCHYSEVIESEMKNWKWGNK